MNGLSSPPSGRSGSRLPPEAVVSDPDQMLGLRRAFSVQRRPHPTSKVLKRQMKILCPRLPRRQHLSQLRNYFQHICGLSTEKVGSRRIAPKPSGALFKLLHCNCGIRPNSKFLNSKEFIKGVHSSPSKRREEQFNLRSLESPGQMETVPS